MRVMVSVIHNDQHRDVVVSLQQLQEDLKHRQKKIWVRYVWAYGSLQRDMASRQEKSKMRYGLLVLYF